MWGKGVTDPILYRVEPLPLYVKKISYLFYDGKQIKDPRETSRKLNSTSETRLNSLSNR